MFGGSNSGGAGGGGGGDTFTNATPTPVTLGGIASGSTFTAQTMTQMWNALLYPYIAPTISLSSPVATGVYEFGNPQAPVLLNATTVRHTNPISSVIFQRSNNGGAYAIINTVAVPLPNGGLEMYPDPVGVGSFATSQYRSTVGDGTATANSNVLTYQYVYPYYYGVGAPGLAGAQIAALTKLVQTQQNTDTVTSPTVQVYYFAYPSAYPVLTSILDQSGFETIADYTVRTVTITGLDGTPQSYRVYEFNNLTTQVAFTNHYIY